MPIQFRSKRAIASFAQHTIFEINFHCYILLSVVFFWVVFLYVNKPQLTSFYIYQHWGCFHFLAIMNNNTMNILSWSFSCEHMYLFLLDKCIREELLVVNFMRNCLIKWLYDFTAYTYESFSCSIFSHCSVEQIFMWIILVGV